jgi:hypothetical protein
MDSNDMHARHAPGTVVKWKRSRFAKGGGKGRSYRVVGHDGMPCPRCGEPTEIREHTEITKQHLRQPFYFSRWFYCRNHECKVTLHMVEQFKVWNRRSGRGPKKRYRRPRYRHDPEFQRVTAECRAQDGPPPWDE